MQITRKSGLAAAAIPFLLAVTTAGSAAAAPGAAVSGGAARDSSAAAPSSQDLPFTFSVSGLPAGQTFEVVYSANETGLSGYTQASSGSMTGAGFASNSVYLTASTGGPLSAGATVILSVGTAPVTGTASIPSGTTVTLTNGLTGQKITLTNGSFSIPSGVGVGVSGPGIDVMFSPLRAPGLALTGPAAAGRRVGLRPARPGSPAQVWHLNNPGNPSVTAIANSKTGLCLQVTGPTYRAQLIAAACNGSAGQEWTETEQPNGTWQLENKAVSGPGLFVTGPPLRARPATRPVIPRFSADWLETITS
jgi:hypothetical protein